VIAFFFENEAAQTAAIVASYDVGKVALRQDDFTVWLLASVSPSIVWVPLSGGSAGGGGGGPIVTPASGPATSLVGEDIYTCGSNVGVGDFVFLDGNNTVGLADASSMLTMPCLGVVKSKPHVLEAIVQYLGDAPLFTGLEPDTNYYVSPTQPGKIQTSLPVASAGQSVVLQRVGTARNSTTLILSIDATDFVVLEG
jgi:hypothetical protein